MKYIGGLCKIIGVDHTTCSREVSPEVGDPPILLTDLTCVGGGHTFQSLGVCGILGILCHFAFCLLCLLCFSRPWQPGPLRARKVQGAPSVPCTLERWSSPEGGSFQWDPGLVSQLARLGSKERYCLPSWYTPLLSL